MCSQGSKPSPWGQCREKPSKTFESTSHSALAPGLSPICPALGSSCPPMEPEGLLIRGSAAATFEVNRGKESVLGSARSSVQEQVMWGHPWSPHIVPISSRGTVPRGGTWTRGEVSTTVLRAWGTVLLWVWTQCPGAGAAPAEPLLPPSTRHLDPGPLGSWALISHLLTEALVPRLAGKWSHWEGGVSRAENRQ